MLPALQSRAVIAMPEPIDFYFDFSSPYSYLANPRIDGIAARHGRDVHWHPFMLGAAFKVAHTQPLTHYPLKGEYSVRDFERCGRLHGIPFAMPEKFPVATLGAARAFYWLEASAPEKAKPFAQAIFAAYFADGRDISALDVVADVAAGFGIDSAALAAAVEQPAIKARLKEETDAAIARGVFGAPFVIVDGEPFWGADRLEMVERWLATGGW